MEKTLDTNANKVNFYYLALDLIDIKENYNNLLQIYTLLDTAINKVLKFKTIHKPVLIPYYYGKIKRDCGISCYSFFDGGYITIHIFEKRKIAYLDIVSHKDFDKEQIINFISQELETNKYNKYTEITTSNLHSKNIFGPHYFAHGQLKEAMNIDNLLLLQEKIIKEINMTPIINPVIVKDNDEIRLFIAIAESHISLTLNKKYFYIDVFSCKMFDINKLKKILNLIMPKYDEILFIRSHKIYN